MRSNLTILAGQWYETLADTVKDKIITPILVLLAAAGIIYAIVVGIKFVKAEDKSGREEAKAKLLSVLIGIGVTVVLIALFIWLSIQFRDKNSSLNKDMNDLLPTWSVVYDEDGGSDVSDARGLELGNTITLAKAPTKEGSTFGGWKMEDGTTWQPEAKYELKQEHDVDGNGTIELVAVWN